MLQFEFVKQLFRKKQPPQWPVVPDDFPAHAARAIQLLTASDGQLEDAQVLTLFEENGIPYQEAVELLLFLPVAFCRHMLSQLAWPGCYSELTSDNKTLAFEYAANKRYAIILSALSKYISGEFTRADYLKIAGRAASFNAINQLLNAGGKLIDVVLALEVIVR